MEKSDRQIERTEETDHLESGRSGNNVLQILVPIAIGVIFYTMENPMEGLVVLICVLVTLHIVDNRIQTESKLREIKHLRWLVEDIFLPDEVISSYDNWYDRGRGAAGYLNRIYRYLEIIEKKMDKI